MIDIPFFFITHLFSPALVLEETTKDRTGRFLGNSFGRNGLSDLPVGVLGMGAAVR